MEAENIEAVPEFQLELVPAPGELPQDHLKERLEFFKELRSQGIKVKEQHYSNDAVGGGAGIIYVIVTVLGPVAIVQLRKLLETYLKRGEKRKFKITNGPMIIEGDFSDVRELITDERFKMLQGAPKSRKKISDE
jgi:hypothetical protein